MANKSEDEAYAISVILYLDSVTYSSCMQLCRICKYWGQKAKVLYIFHKGEPGKDAGHELKDHIHVLVVYEHGHMSIKKFQKDFDISGACIEKIGDWREYVRYLLHRTPDSAKKIQYNLEDFNSNFDVTPIFNSLIDNTTPEGYMVLEIIDWATKNKASSVQVIKHVINMGYPWKKFHDNANIIFRSIDENKYSNGVQIFEQKKLRL